MRIRALEIESFRGYGKRYRFEFPETDVVILYGPNGNGKTSFFDAIEWGLTGTISRYENKSDERRRTRFIGNRFSPCPPKVMLELQQGNIHILVCRYSTVRGTAKTDYGDGTNTLKVTVGTSMYLGDEAERYLSKVLIRDQWRERITLQTGLRLTNLLGQEQMSALIRGMKDSDRYHQLSNLFGTQHFHDRYVGAFQNARRLVQPRLEDIQNQIKVTAEVLKQIEGDLEKTNHQSDGYNQAQLHQTFTQHMRIFGRVMPDSEQLPELNIIKRQLANDRLFVEEQQKNYERRNKKLSVAEQAFINWRTAKPQRDKKFKQYEIQKVLDAIDEKRQGLQWIIDQTLRFKNITDEQNSFNATLNAKLNDIERETTLIKDLRTAQEVGNRLLELVRTDFKDSSEDFCVLLSSMPSIWDDRLHLISVRIQQCFREWNMAKEDQTVHEKEIKRSKEMIHQVQVINENYRDLLETVQKYAKINAEIKSCPACGTSGITSQDLLKHVRQQQNYLHPDLAMFQDTLERVRQQATVTEQLVVKKRAEIDKAVDELVSFLGDLTNLLNDAYKHVLAMRNDADFIRREIEGLEFFRTEYQKRASQLGIVDTTRAESQAFILARSLEVERTALEQNYHLLVPDSFPVRLTDLERDIKQLDATLNDYIEKLIIIPGLEEGFGKLKNDWINDCIENERSTVKRTKTEIDYWELSNSELNRDVTFMETFNQAKTLQERCKTQEAILQQFRSYEDQLLSDLRVIDTAIKSVPSAVDRLNVKVMDQLFEEISRVYQRIGPHPLYKELGYDKNNNFKANRLLYTVSDGEHGETEANPSFIFSAAQINGVALSTFLTMALKQRWTPLELIAMDDPVQSMDDLNASFLTDFIRDLAKSHANSKQFIISTHDLTFYRLMSRKFRYLNVATIQFEGLTKDGPIVTVNDHDTVQIHSRLSLASGESELKKIFGEGSPLA